MVLLGDRASEDEDHRSDGHLIVEGDAPGKKSPSVADSEVGLRNRQDCRVAFRKPIIPKNAPNHLFISLGKGESRGSQSGSL